MGSSNDESTNSAPRTRFSWDRLLPRSTGGVTVKMVELRRCCVTCWCYNCTTQITKHVKTGQVEELITHRPRLELGISRQVPRDMGCFRWALGGLGPEVRGPFRKTLGPGRAFLENSGPLGALSGKLWGPRSPFSKTIGPIRPSGPFRAFSARHPSQA